MSDPTMRRAAGRPRRLTLEMIVDAACEIGISGLEMSLLAERLHTGVATLYGYVRGREHLLELVAQRLAMRSLVKDCGQSWQDILREHAAMTYSLFQQLPQLITKLMIDEPDAQSIDYARTLLGLLESRGMDRRTATNAYVEINQVVIGAAICLLRREMVAPVSVDEAGRPVPLPDSMGDYRPTMERIIAGYDKIVGQSCGRA